LKQQVQQGTKITLKEIAVPLSPIGRALHKLIVFFDRDRIATPI
jgi:hypothetical protein